MTSLAILWMLGFIHLFDYVEDYVFQLVLKIADKRTTYFNSFVYLDSSCVWKTNRLKINVYVQLLKVLETCDAIINRVGSYHASCILAWSKLLVPSFTCFSTLSRITYTSSTQNVEIFSSKSNGAYKQPYNRYSFEVNNEKFSLIASTTTSIRYPNNSPLLLEKFAHLSHIYAKICTKQN